MPRWTRSGHALARKTPGSRGWKTTLAGIVLLIGATILAAWLDPLPPPVAGSARASDGDSFHLGPDRVRLLGIDAPELDQTCSRADGTDWNCGREARDRMAELLAGGSVTCLPQGDDQYGRLLAHCTAAGTDIGAEMVEAGLAIGRGEYGREESAARNAKRGIWQGRFVSPREWRDQGPQSDPEWGPIEQGWNWLRELTGARPLR